MTFCIATQVRQGFLALTDTEIVNREERVTRPKLSFIPNDYQTWWLINSGLSAIRHKAPRYLHQDLSNEANQDQQLFELANRFGNSVRRVRKEDGRFPHGGTTHSVKRLTTFHPKILLSCFLFDDSNYQGDSVL